MSLAKKYFNGRLQSISRDGSRGLLAAREVQTLKALYRITRQKEMRAYEIFLDLGCGDRYLRDEIEAMGLNYEGFDIDDCNLMNEAIPASDNYADYVVSYSLIEHLPDPDNFLREAFRVLKPGGLLVLETPNWHHSGRDFFNDYTHSKPYTPASLRALCGDYGFVVMGDFPNLRCKPDWFYTNKYRYRVAASLPFTGSAWPIVPQVLRGRAKGMILLATKPD